MRLSLSQFSLVFFVNLMFLPDLSSETPQHYVDKVHKDIMQVVIKNQSIYKDDPKEFIGSIEKALEPLVDFQRISRNVMGKHYRQASTIQRDKFSKIFKSTLLDTYAKTLAEFKNEEIKILPKREDSINPKRDKVYLQIITETKIYPAVYDMYLNNQNKWKIINIIINGVNLGITFRNQFYSLMDKEENDIDKVINIWITSL